jgi:hypothetical protein
LVNKSGYTEKETEKLLSLYEVYGTDGLEEIAKVLEKPVKSVRSKLVRENVYKAPTRKYTKKTGKSKKELLRELEEIVSEDLSGLLGATKESLVTIITVLKKEK